MTALNAFRSKDRVIILTDTGSYGRDGKILRFSRKCIVDEALGLAWATSGVEYWKESLAKYLTIGGEAPFPNIDAVVRDGEGFLANWFRLIGGSMEGLLAQEGIPRKLDAYVAIAGWSRQRDEAMLCFYSSNLGFHVNPNNALMPFDDKLGQAFRGVSADGFSADSQARDLLEYQRRQVRAGLNGEIGANVAGSVDLTLVERDGFKCSRLWTWPEDQVGQVVDRRPLPPSGMSRAQRRAWQAERRRKKP